MYTKRDRSFILQKNPWLADVHLFEETSSTQLEAKISGQTNTLYLAGRQTATYGRFGRGYFADEGGIYMSLCLRPNLSFEELPQYTLLMAAATISAIERLTSKRPQIKWVNDIYLDGKKIAGILTESAAFGENLTQIIIGIGINFAITDFPEELADKAGTLFEKENTPVTPVELIAEIWSEFDRLSREDFLSFYKAHSFILGKTVQFQRNGESFEGLASDLTDKGELVVTFPNGGSQILSSGEISLKKWTSN